jgi:hypothetical protein
MSHVIATTVYTFAELSDAAKEKARDWYREGAFYYDWYEFVFEDAKKCGRTCFEGRYSYAKQSAKKIREYAPKDNTLHSIADALQAIQSARFYHLEARVKQSGHYSHEFCTDIDVFDGSTGDYATIVDHDAIANELRRFMKWIYRQLEAEWDYLNSDESVDEMINANEYTFTESGQRFG